MPQRSRAWTIFSVMAATYCLSQFYRLSTAVIAVDLARQFRLDPGQLSLLGGAFYYAFALAQLPVGFALDRWGARRVVVVATLVGAAGAFLFATSSGWPGLVAGRVLMGLGMAPVLMGSFTLFAQWFPASSFGSLSGLILAVGTGGALLAATPLAGLVAWLGWRGSFAVFGALTLVASAAVAGFVRDGRPTTQPVTDPGGVFSGLGRVLALPSFWAMAPLALVGYAAMASFQGLWAGPYFMGSLGYSRAETGNILLALGAAGALGSLAGGVLSDRWFRSRKWVVVGGNAMACGFLLPLLGVASPSGPAGWAATFAGFGFFSAFRVLLYAHIKESVPACAVGAAVTTANFFVMIGPALLQQAIGLVLLKRPGDYHAGFTVLVIALAVGTMGYLGTRDTHPSRSAPAGSE